LAQDYTRVDSQSEPVPEIPTVDSTKLVISTLNTSAATAKYTYHSVDVTQPYTGTAADMLAGTWVNVSHTGGRHPGK